MDMAINQYRNLAGWKKQDWEQLDIHLFIAANFSRYCNGLMKKVGLQYLPSDASENMLGLFCDVAHKPLRTVHQKNLNAEGERRNQIMLGTLKMITFTRMVEALIREYPSYIALEHLPEAGDDDEFSTYPVESDDDSFVFTLPSQSCASMPLYAAVTVEPVYHVDAEDDSDDDRISTMVEVLRSYLTPVQYRHVRYAICDGLDSQEIANLTGCSVTNVRIMLLNARKRMMDLVPAHLLPAVQECLHRK